MSLRAPRGPLVRHSVAPVAWVCSGLLSCTSSTAGLVPAPPDVVPSTPADVASSLDLSGTAGPGDVGPTHDGGGSVDVVDAAAPETPPLLPVFVGCGGNDRYETAICVPDGYCTFSEDGVPRVECCDAPCDGELGGAGVGSPVMFTPADWKKHPTLPDGAPCQEIGYRLRTWLYGLGHPRHQWAEVELVDKQGQPCAAERLDMAIECYPSYAASEVVVDEPTRRVERCPLTDQGDGKVRQVWVRWHHSDWCGEGAQGEKNPDANGWCHFGYAWVTPERAPWRQ